MFKFYVLDWLVGMLTFLTLLCVNGDRWLNWIEMRNTNISWQRMVSRTRQGVGLGMSRALLQPAGCIDRGPGAAGKGWGSQVSRTRQGVGLGMSRALLQPAGCKTQFQRRINQSKCVEWCERGKRKRSVRWARLRCDWANGPPMMCSLVRTRRSCDFFVELWNVNHFLPNRWTITEQLTSPTDKCSHLRKNISQ